MQNKNQAIHHDSRQRNMGPPPTPQQARQPMDAPPPSTRRTNTSLPLNNRSLPPGQRFAPPAPVDPQHFTPSTSNGAPQRFSVDGGGSRPLATPSGASSRAVMNTMSGGGQRVPFVPHASGGFG
ncbi:hypothetical protein K438DRAFT_1226986 [Mycena galopus ATCC 62051]|nr:hypothetical protein K438DRAFT_1226986 [Mycena galopus ATCC 62051]